MEYRTISERCEASFVEKKSEFIGYICPVQTEEQAIEFINEIRALHRKATHNCYAYILRKNNTARYSDDGEPSGTAGVPIYEVLRKEEITDICCVVTRYFGGILLGGGGLVRAYSKSVKLAIDASKIKLMAMAQEMTVIVDYPLYGKLGAVFAEFDARIQEEIFAQNVTVRFFLREIQAQAITEKLIDICNGAIEMNLIQKHYYDFALN